jgi:hypothetical protein
MQGAEWTGCEMRQDHPTGTHYKDERTIDLDISKQGDGIRGQGEGSGSGGKVVVAWAGSGGRSKER